MPPLLGEQQPAFDCIRKIRLTAFFIPFIPGRLFLGMSMGMSDAACHPPECAEFRRFFVNSLHPFATQDFPESELVSKKSVGLSGILSQSARA